jgi:hypothetical protein
MFCVCVVIILILVSFALCCAPSRIYVLFHFYFLSSCVSVFAAFEWILCPPSSTYQPIYCKLMRCLCTVFCLFIDVCIAFMRAFIYSSTCASPSRGLYFTFENSILNYSLSLGLCVCVLELFALGLGAGVVDVVCLSKH